MNFLSNEFLLFLLACWGTFLILPQKLRCPFLLLASYVFYASWSIPFVLVIVITTTIDYLSARIVYNSSSSTIRRCALLLAIAINLAVLSIFKYFNFFLHVQTTFFALLHVHSPMPQHLNILLPLGISYYTFEAISYLVDVYRGGKPAPGWWQYNFYIMWFPHLISGPIVRFNELWPQYSHGIAHPNRQRLAKGVELIVLGYFFKTVIANSCALISDPFFAHPQGTTVLSAYAASLAFGLQLYFDFLAYTHIARGASLLFNIELPINFNHPLHSTNMSEFWKRWQISLSRWLHDYVFVPLGGARKSLPRTISSLLITMLIAGVWHGAGWSFVLLGLYFGVTLAIYHTYRRFRKRLLGSAERQIICQPIYHYTAHWLTFWLIIISGIIFRSPDVRTACYVTGRLFRFLELYQETVQCLQTGDLTTIGTCFIILACFLSGPWLVKLYTSIYKPMPYWLRAQVATAVVVLCWIACCDTPTPFIYFQF